MEELMLYNQIIRELIAHENRVRDDRNKWQYAIYAFMLGGYVTVFVAKNIIVYNYIICLIISIMGLLISLSFIYAAWRSSLAISMALNCWNLALERNRARIIDCPPVCLITKNIIEQRRVSPDEDIIGANEWNEIMYERLLGERDELVTCITRELNKADFLMPYKMCPANFNILWLFIFIISLAQIF